MAGAAQEVQERQADAQPGDDEAVPGGGRQPADGLPSVCASAAAVLRAVQRAARRSPTGSPASRRSTGCRSRWWRAPSTPRSSARTIADKFLFTGALHVPLHAKARHSARRADQHDDDVPDGAAEQEARHDAGGDARTTRWRQSQKYMTYIMPFFALTGLYWPFGLVLYWVTTNSGRSASSTCCSAVPVPDAAAHRRSSDGHEPGRGAGRDHAAEAPGQVRARGARRSRTGLAGRQGRTARRSPPRTSRASQRAQPGRELQGCWPPATAIGGEDLRDRSGGASARQHLGEWRRRAAMLRRLSKRPKPEPEPAGPPDVKLVRQQRQRQSAQ